MTLTFDHLHGLDLGFPRPNFEMAVSQEWEGGLTLNKMRCESMSKMTRPVAAIKSLRFAFLKDKSLYIQ